MDMNRALRAVVQTGEVHFGVRQAMKAAANSTAQLIVVAENIPMDVFDELKGFAAIPLVKFKGTNYELGTVCGKPFSVGALTVIEAGDSDILDSIS
jgi:large subunit ribosomal protein L30e